VRRPHELLVFVHRGCGSSSPYTERAKEVYWHVVAGALEQDETPAEAAARELEEESVPASRALWSISGAATATR